MNLSIKLLAGAGLLAASQVMAAPMFNPGFEQGTYWAPGWVNNAAVVLGSIRVASNTDPVAQPKHQGIVSDGDPGNIGFQAGIAGGIMYSAPEGDYYLVLGAGEGDEWATAGQTFDMVAGQYLNVWAAFDWGDYDAASGYQDGIYVVVKNGSGTVLQTLFGDSGLFHPDFYDGAWTATDFTATYTGTYTLEFGVRNTTDNSNPSWGLFDAYVSSDKIPEPATLALMGLGLIGLGLSRRRIG